jgi:ferrochelatase
MAYGTPDQPEDIRPYYTDIRRGRAPSDEQLAELTARYAAIGGGSRLNEISRAQAATLGRALNEGSGDVEYRVYQANRHWAPWISDVVKQMAADGIERAVAIVLAPQGSKMSSGAYFDRVDAANADLPVPINFTYVFSWHLEPAFIEAEAAKVAEALAKFPEGNREQLAVMFTCHSLPERILTWQDPYPQHLREIGEAVAGRVGLQNVHYGYQSAGRTPEPWLGPDVRDAVAALAAAGEKSVLICSVGFISDHLEVLYDLDIEMREAARELGVHFERMAMLNESPLLAEAMASAVRKALDGGERS